MTAPVIPSPRTPEPDPWQLVARAQGGDSQAFAALYDLHNMAVYHYLWLRCGNVQTAQDWAQDVWERALRGIRGLKRGSVPPLAWLIRIARNRAIDYYRSPRYRLELVDTEVADRAADRADPSEDPALTVMERAASAVMLAAVRQLAERQQEAIALTYFVGLNSAEAAAVMGVSANAVKALTMRGRRALALLLAGEQR